MSEVISANLRVRRGLGLVSIAVPKPQPGDFAQALQGQCGLALPEPGHWVGNDTLALLWCAPQQFLAVGEADATQQLMGALPTSALTIDLAGSRMVVRLSGTAARDILARMVPLDLHPRAIGPGRVASTIAAHIGVQIWQIDDAPTYDIACLVSYSGSLLRAFQLSGAPSVA